ncbi:rab3 GTPase-activating protein regulatory subunit isoform X2 [Leptidea sinapis]|uniref:rab3 GTPase-activating protein regulatory subunit isoform X2 n=1 Tax=Leptidea sinapis TaxID=189913 RepID=UPI0021C38326|nr:rab3 GTPase-activating protein regulatory subunit isoform X2 [Leptidea sinapis]
MCNVEQIADCGDISSLGRTLFISDRDDSTWITSCFTSLSSCGNFLAVGYKNRLCFMNTQWISSTDTNSFIISWSGTLPSEIKTLLCLSLCPTHQSSQSGPDWFCVIVGFINGCVGFYSNTGHLLMMEKLDEKPVLKISCHTGTYGTMPDDIHILFTHCIYIISGASLFQTLRMAKAQLAKGVQEDYAVDNKSIKIRKWIFSGQDCINDAAVVGLDLKNTYDHLLAASVYGGYEVWYRSVPPVNSLIVAAGEAPYVGFHYAVEGGTAPPLQDVARAVANKIKSALPGWLGGSTETAATNTEPLIRAEALMMRNGLYDSQRNGNSVVISLDRRLAAITDNLGRVAVLDINKGYLIRLFKGCRDAQCSFIQLFDSDAKKPQLSVVKDIKRAVFLVIYNPKKGLVDIRLMQRGNRVAVFTATKNGKLIYNTCGLVGAHKSYTHKKLNLPEFQCVLLDPDGKIKKFNIPFYYSLEGEHLDRSKDLHILRGMREILKRLSNDDEVMEEIIQSVSKLKTVEIKRHCLEILIKHFNSFNKVVMNCIDIIWDSVFSENSIDEKNKEYVINLVLTSLFYRYIKGEDNTEDIERLVDKIRIHYDVSYNDDLDITERSITDGEIIEFHLLEDDSCVLERLLMLAQEKDYKEYQHARVTFADSRSNEYQEFISCFVLDKTSKCISLKTNISEEKLFNVASNIFASIMQLNYVNKLSYFLKKSLINSKDIIKLVLLHVMNMPLEEINIDLIENVIKILYYICQSNTEAKNITYNEISPWWESIRVMIIDMPCPLRSMIIAMVCKAVVKIIESEGSDGTWESVTAENAKWQILIGKLEDISILSIILIFKESYNGKAMPKVQLDDIKINFKFIYTRGKGSVTELIAKWLCNMGTPPEAIIANELMNTFDMSSTAIANTNDDFKESDDPASYVLMENNRQCIDDNPKIFKWLSLLRRQFPLSTKTDYIIANMCWEYAVAWQKNVKNTEILSALIQCLVSISNTHLQLGLFSIIWSTYLKQIFEINCRLINKIGKLPKDQFCEQEVGFNCDALLLFFENSTKFLAEFYKCLINSRIQEKEVIEFEKIWDESLPSLVEVAQESVNVNSEILKLNHQISCTIYYQCYFNVKFSKPLDTLYDIDYQYIFDSLVGSAHRELNLQPSEKLTVPRKKYLTKLIRAAIETISCVNTQGENIVYNDDECLNWIDNVSCLAECWNIDVNFVRRQHVIGLYHLGYDALVENKLGLILDPSDLLSPLVAITIQRLKRDLENTPNPSEWIVSVPPQIYKRLQTTALDSSIPSSPSLISTLSVLQKLLALIDKKTTEGSCDPQELKLASVIVECCEILVRRKL